jgi:replicative DNA helicase
MMDEPVITLREYLPMSKRNVEALLISSVLRNDDITSALAQGVNPSMFHTHDEEWDWMERFYKRHRKVPGKAAFKQEFPKFRIAAADDTAHFAEEVKKRHARIELTSVLNDVTDDLAHGDVGAALRQLQKTVVHISSTVDAASDTDIIDAWQDMYTEVDRRVKAVKLTGLAGMPTGFPVLDEKTGGPQPGDLWVYGARLGTGKTWTLLNGVVTCAMRGYTVQFDSLEQSRAQVGMRIHSLLSGNGRTAQSFNNRDLMQGKGFSQRDYKAFLKQLRQDVTGRIHVTDTSRGRVSTAAVAAQIERNQPDIVFIDYLTLMDMGGEKTWQSVGNTTKELKTIAMSYQVPIVIASQLNRSEGARSSGPPGPESLSEADAIGHDADAIITSVPFKGCGGVIHYGLVKFRNGEMGFQWYVDFRPGEGIMDTVTYNKALELKDIWDEERDVELAK